VQLKSAVSQYWEVLLLFLALLLVLLWLRHAVKRNEVLQLNVLGKHVIEVRHVSLTDAHHTRQAREKTRADDA
jgi:hypothetical protein